MLKGQNKTLSDLILQTGAQASKYIASLVIGFVSSEIMRPMKSTFLQSIVGVTAFLVILALIALSLVEQHYSRMSKINYYRHRIRQLEIDKHRLCRVIKNLKDVN